MPLFHQQTRIMTIKDVQFTDERWLDFWSNYKGEPHQREAIIKLGRHIRQVDPTLLTPTAEWVRDYQAKPEPSEWATAVDALNISQPDEVTCQAACIGMGVRDKDVAGIRRKLLARGTPGSPAVMGQVIREYKVPYRYEGNASLNDCYRWLKAGEFLITHGWFTRSGHVICLDGLRRNPDGSHSLNVKDPWSEFDAPAWLYNLGSKFYDGYYSDLCIYAACVAGVSVSSAKLLYERGTFNPALKTMWVHRFLVL
jgi:hypothetical protein